MPVLFVRTVGMLLCLFMIICATSAQSLVGGSVLAAAPKSDTDPHKLWLRYENSFEFKDRMYIDSDFGHIFSSDKAMRLNVRSVYKYALLDNLKVGAGMGFFWSYGQPNLLQELRFMQEINYVNDFGSSLITHDLRVEQQISQSVEEFDDYNTRLRYRVGLTVPTNGPLYFGIYDEVFKNLSRTNPELSIPSITMNRAGLFAGYNTYQHFKIEAHLTVEDWYRMRKQDNVRSLLFSFVVKQII